MRVRQDGADAAGGRPPGMAWRHCQGSGCDEDTAGRGDARYRLLTVGVGQYGSYEERYGALVEVLKAADADVICLQAAYREAHGQRRDLAAMLAAALAPAGTRPLHHAFDALAQLDGPAGKVRPRPPRPAAVLASCSLPATAAYRLVELGCCCWAAAAWPPRRASARLRLACPPRRQGGRQRPPPSALLPRTEPLDLGAQPQAGWGARLRV